jgi:hypothetical protein
MMGGLDTTDMMMQRCVLSGSLQFNNPLQSVNGGAEKEKGSQES